MNMEERLGILDDIDMDLENIPVDEINEYLDEIIKYCKSLKEE